MNPQTVPTPPPYQPLTNQPLPSPQKKFPLSLVLGVLLVLALAFGGWAFSSKQSIKKDADKELASASSQLKTAQADEAAATAANKSPYKVFTGSSSYGSVTFKYPKSWSAYVDQTSTSQPIDGYFYPGVVPGTQSNTAFALRVELLNSDYAGVIEQMQSDVQDGSLKASAFLPAKLKHVSGAQAGTRFDGVVGQDQNDNPLTGSMVVLKVRDKTLQIYTESKDYLSDFNNIVLPNLSYNP
ncbi:MAG TPA: hypothetical protein VG964_03090 [Candidatus Saccharimonadales bacterium]|nr:hypothetical protein [Candidatus Saccharimonadales bacterium]